MSGNRNIYMGAGGNYNESIQGDYIQGDRINISQDLPQAAAQIQQLLYQLQSQGYSQADAQHKVANDWANEANNDSKAKGTLVKLGDYINNTAANGVIGQAAVEVIILALRFSGIPLP